MNLESQTKIILQSICRKNKIPKFSKLKKKELIALIENSIQKDDLETIINENRGDELVFSNEEIIKSKYQSKNWRKQQPWYRPKSGECEKYQFRLIKQITKMSISKTNIRINTETLEMKDYPYPMINDDGFDWTEDIDGKQVYNDNIFYYNLKFVCDKGGAQTRSLREVYHFIRSQLKVLQNKNNIFFINILDGDQSFKNISKFRHLVNLSKYSSVKDKLFVGDTSEFQEWFLDKRKLIIS